LSYEHSRLTKLKLSHNNLGYSGVTKLCKGLRSENCKLEILRLDSCGVTSRCCSALSSALFCGLSPLTELYLYNNKLGDSGVAKLCEGLRHGNCTLEMLSLNCCELTSGCCSALSSALSDENSTLNELNLSKNELGDSGVEQLCEGLKSENCKLEKLRLIECHLTSTCCSALSSVLSSEHSHLTELDLSDNKLEDLGVEQLCEGLRSENCKLKLLGILIIAYVWCLHLLSLCLHRLSECGLTSGCCSALSSALSTPHSPLTDLDLNDNQLGDSGVDQLCEGLRSENCKLEHLGLSECGLTSGCCSALSLALSAPHSPLTDLDLNYNQLGDSGVDQLCEGLRSENCKLEHLGRAMRLIQDYRG
uniref:Uncharacterized protein n=1 Tax=Erpetoichthys calabaricus TaxID=27687 RepID=A0A8C4T866_ERPCA